jgi:penicillin-binding protein 1B
MRLKELAKKFVRTRHFKILAVVCAVFCIVSGGIAVHYYQRYTRIIDQRLNGPVFENTAKIYDSSGKLLTLLSGEDRAKRRLVEFSEIPKNLIDAVTAGEDQKFFVHHGLDLKRIVGALVWNVRENHGLQGASTITQQLARSFFLTREPTMRRKISEAFIAILLELRLTKEQIFTMYANEVYLGERGLYAIHGFGEAAHALFGKKLGELTLAEAATLAGIIPAPNSFSPTRQPERAIVRRDLILKLMRQRGHIDEENFQVATNAPLMVIQSPRDVTEASYFVDHTRSELLKNYSEEQVMYGGYSVHTTLDLNLQKAAVDAVAKGLALVDKEFAARNKKKGAPQQAGPPPQAALIALDPRTGEIKAMVGGSDYAASQYNRITDAFRQPGSVFKPFVYAAALETAYTGRGSSLNFVPAAEASTARDAGFPSITTRLITPLTKIMDAPRVFSYAGVSYEPNNFKGGYAGIVTLRTALQKSLNSAAVQVAETIGYNRVARLAHRMGLNDKIKGYPSVALGAFEVTPLELAGAYTAFANQGKHVEPHAVRRVETADGANVTAVQPQPSEVIRPQIAYVMTNLMEGVINRGTAAGARARGFKLPAAGKTGTSRDGWFVGYTKDLLVISWVGFDDNRDLDLEGSRSALPIWTEFMLQAYALYPPKNRMHFTPPPGIDFVTIDAETMMRATPDCIDTFQEVFIQGTAPGAYCPLHSPQIATGIDTPIDGAAPVNPTKVSAPATPEIIRAKPGGIN